VLTEKGRSGGGVDGIRAVMLCAAGALVCAVIRHQRPEFRLAVAAAVGLAAVGLSMDGIGSGVDSLRALAEEAGMERESVSVLIRATGLALIAEFGAQLCRDADESALAGRVELAGRAALMGMTAPLMTGLLRQVAELLP